MKVENKIKYPASCVVQWTTGPVNCCEKHGQALAGLGRMLGSNIVITRLLEESECKNCVNENQ